LTAEGRAPYVNGTTMKSLTLIGAAALALGCAELRDVLTLQQGLAREFNEPAINVNINTLNSRTSLTVTFSNPAVVTLPDNERAELAQRVAEYVRDRYPHYSSLASIDVGFVTVRKTGPATFTNTTVPYHFTPRDLGPAKVSHNKNTVTYLPRTMG
jgi:hypothetical protein